MTMEIVGKNGEPLSSKPKEVKLTRPEKRELRKKILSALKISDDFLIFMWKKGEEEGHGATSSAKIGSYQNIVGSMLDQFYKNGDVANIISMVIGNIQQKNPEIIEQILNMAKKAEENE